MVIAPLTAIGLGFLINDLILLPLVLVFLLMTLWGLHRGRSGPASIGLLAVRALSGAPPGKRAVEKIDLPGEETVAARRLKEKRRRAYLLAHPSYL